MSYTANHKNHAKGKARWLTWAGYPITLLLEGAITAGLLALHPYFPLGEYPIVYVITIMGVAYWLGEGPAVLAFVAGLVIFEAYFVPPAGLSWPPADSPEGWARFLAFFLGTSVVAFSMVIIRRSQRRSQLLANGLRESNEQVTSILESIRDAFFALDRDWRVTYVNSEAVLLLQKSREELLSGNLWELFPEAVGTMFHEQYHKAMSEGARVQFEAWYEPFEQWFGVRAYGSENGLSVYFHDVTEVVELRQTIQRQLALLQEALVPPAPSVSDGFDVAAVYQPASPGHNIGGDLYDVFSTETGQIGIVVGDVLGQGIEAASLAAAARGMVHSFAYELASPGEALMHANAVVHSQAAEKFVTLFLAIIDPLTGSLTYASAGHPPAAVWRVGGRVEFLDGGDLPMGLSAKQEYQTLENQLGPGDKIILYTDGVIEARRGKEFFQAEGISRFLSVHGKGTAHEVASGLLETARDYASGRLHDDVAILVIERARAL